MRNTVVVSASVMPPVAAKLRELAAEDERTVSYLLNKVIAEFFERHEIEVQEPDHAVV